MEIAETKNTVTIISLFSFRFALLFCEETLAEHHLVGDKEAASDHAEIHEADNDVGNAVVGEAEFSSDLYHAARDEGDEETARLRGWR